MSGAMNAPININIQANNLAAIAGIRASVDTLRSALDSFARTASLAGRALNGLENSIRGLDHTMKYILAGTVIGLSGSFIMMASDLERLGITLATVENSFAKAEIALDRMLVLTQKAPFSLTAIHEAFVKLRASGIEPIIDSAGNGPLKNLLDAVAAFGGTDEQVKRVALAIEQMAGKGVVSLEELRRQMGQQIPTAIRLMAEGMGISVAKLISDISRGTVAFNDSVPPMLDKFREKYSGAGELLANSFAGALRLVTAELNKFAVTLIRAGALDVMIAGIQTVVRAMRALNSAASVDAVKGWMDSLMRFADRNADAFVRAITTIQEFGSAFATIVSALFGALSKLPAESVAGGILGWMIFGRVGLVAGAILGPATDVVMGVASAIAFLFNAVVGVISNAGGVTNAIRGWMDSLINFAERNADAFARAITAIQDFASAFANIIGALFGAMSQLPVEAVAGGIIGWLIFGRIGLVAGAILAPASDVVIGVASAIASLFTAVVGFISSAGIETTSIATYGLIGWLLFGRTGLLAGVLLSLVDRFFGAIRTNLATMFADVAGIAAAVSDPLNFGTAFTGAKESFLKNNTTSAANPDGGKGFFGFGDISKNPFQELFSQNTKSGGSAVAGGAVAGNISRISQTMAELRENITKTRAEFDGKFGQVDDIPGLSTNAMRGIERFGQALGNVQDRLEGAEGSPIDTWVNRQKRTADKFESDVIQPMEAAWRKFNEQGKFKDADSVMRSLGDAWEQVNSFRKNVDRVAALEKGKVASRIGDRAEGSLGRFGNTLESLNVQLTAFEERFTSGWASAEAEAAKIDSQFAPMVRQIDNMRIAVGQLKGAESGRTAVLEELSFVEERLNTIRAQGIAIALRKAARERSDAIEDATRGVRTLGSQVSVAELGQSMFGADRADTLARKEAAQSQVDGITDKVTEMRRRLEDTPGDTWLPQFIDKLEQIRGRFIKLSDNVGTTQEALDKIAHDLGQSVGGALEDGLGSSIEALITRTKTLGDVVKTMYAEITRAAIQYLMKQALIKMGSSDGSFGSLLSGLFGAVTGAGAGAASGALPVFTDVNIISARGNVFSKFAAGGTFTNSIVRGPTQFPMGLMGEAGPEAVMPLTNVNGKLGVAASGGGGDNYNINITAVDGASVARLFSEHGGALVDTMRQRDRLNRGYGKR